MKAIILAAGYATQLYPLTEKQPKALLPVAGKPMMEYILDNLARALVVDEVVVVSNARFHDQFGAWKQPCISVNSITEYASIRSLITL